MSFFFYFFFDDQESMFSYLENQFQKDLESLDVRPIDDELTLEEFPQLKGQSYFGRPEWENYGRDVSGVSKKTGKKIYKDEFYVCPFIECLFVHTLINRTLETYYPDKFEKYRYNFIPRFGWFNFGYSDERLPYLLDVPQKNGVPFSDLKRVKDIISVLLHIIKIDVLKLGIDYDDFIAKICEDVEIKRNKFLKYKSYKLTKDSAFNKFATILKRRIKNDLEKNNLKV